MNKQTELHINDHDELIEMIGAANIDEAKRIIYDNTECGAWLDFSDEDSISVGSIVEGSDVEIGPFGLEYPFLSDTFWEVVQDVNDEACAAWHMENDDDWDLEEPWDFDEPIELFV